VYSPEQSQDSCRTHENYVQIAKRDGLFYHYLRDYLVKRATAECTILRDTTKTFLIHYLVSSIQEYGCFLECENDGK